MSKPAIAVAPTESLAQAYKRLLFAGISSLAVVENNSLVGVISRTDLLRVGRRAASSAAMPNADARHVLLEFPETTVAEIMTREVCTVTPEESIARASKVMCEQHVHRVFVKDATQIGVFSTLDAMRAILTQGADEPISDFMTSPVSVVDIEDTIGVAVAKLESNQVSGLIAVENDWPVGVFTQVEALAARGLDDSSIVDDAMDPALICMPITTTMRRAAQQALRMRVRRVVASENRHMRGILSGLDFAKYASREA